LYCIALEKNTQDTKYPATSQGTKANDFDFFPSTALFHKSRVSETSFSSSLYRNTSTPPQTTVNANSDPTEMVSTSISMEKIDATIAENTPTMMVP
jgi:hypothetical protein